MLFYLVWHRPSVDYYRYICKELMGMASLSPYMTSKYQARFSQPCMATHAHERDEPLFHVGHWVTSLYTLQQTRYRFHLQRVRTNFVVNG